MVFEFEIKLIRWINSLAGLNPVFDEALMKAHDLPSVKIMPLTALLWYLWFKDAKSRLEAINGLAGALLALVISRLMQNFLPPRPRPAHSDEVGFQLPAGAVEIDLSSFPSDHAALAFALAAAIFSASRGLGWFAFAWATVIACLPRLYGGYHYPTDLIAGAVLGVLCVRLAVTRTTFTENLRAATLGFEERHSAVFYTLAFVVTYQITSLFDDIRSIGNGLVGLFS